MQQSLPSDAKSRAAECWFGGRSERATKMTEKQTSNTAIFTAMLRALHQTCDSEPKVLVDPVSVIFARQFEASAAWATYSALPNTMLRQGRSSISLRNRYAEDVLQEVTGQGKCQYVILGAGFDTFAYRQPTWAHMTSIFEIDHPATQKTKRKVLIDAEISIPENLYFCPLDFQKISLRTALAESSFEFDVPAVFSWLGVTQYLTHSAILETLSFIQSLPRLSTAVFSFLPTDEVLDEEDIQLIADIDRRASDGGEPFISRFDPQALQLLLHDIGFKTVYHLRPEVAQERYFMDRTDGLKASSVEQLMRATV